MRELTIQAEVGRRLRSAIAKRKGANKFHWNKGDGDFIERGKNDDIPDIIEKLIASGAFSSADKVGLQALAPDTLRALAAKFIADDADDEEGDLRMNSGDEDHEDFIHCGRPKAMRRELPEVRARRNQRMGVLAPNRRGK